MTSKAERQRETQKLMNAAAASLRARTGQAIAAGPGAEGDTVPPRSRYVMASLLEALTHEVARDRLSQWTTTEAVKLCRSILDEGPE